MFRAARTGTLWVRLAQRSPFVYLDRPLAAWRMWEGQGSTDARMMLRSASRVRTKYFPEPGPFTSRYAQIWLGKCGAALPIWSGSDRSRPLGTSCSLVWSAGPPVNSVPSMPPPALVVPSVAERRFFLLSGPNPEQTLTGVPWLSPGCGKCSSRPGGPA